MCGIAGFLRHDPRDDPGDAGRLRAMARMIAHRGPDDEDVWAQRGVGLAHRRLAVIDPNPHGRQPMRRGPNLIAFNGEVYNHREVRRELEALGETFQTNTDTEVLLAALARWDVRALDRLNGMFAFAYWDASRRRLILARDRIGKKPLYYARIDGDLVFGSEIKALLPWPKLARQPNLVAIHHYLSLQYVPAPLTAFEGVMRLPPASVLEVIQGEEPRITRYWTLPHPENATRRDAQELRQEVLDGLRSAVRRRMVADVPVGAFLSGGVDSSAVAALMAEASGQPIKTFSIGFDDAGYDERFFARLVANRIAADHHEDVVRPDAATLLPEIAWHYGEPFADPSALPTYLVSRLARNHVTVALTGDGGDEFFLGYSRYARLARTAWLDDAPTMARALADFGSRLVPPAAARWRALGGVGRRLQMLSASRARRYEPSLMYFQHSDKEEAYGPALTPFLDLYSPDLLAPYLNAAPDAVSGAAWADIHTYLADDILVKVDVASMAFGLEARAPFLDVGLMELAGRIPADVKMPGGALKGLLKEALSPVVPPEVLDRPKMGFGVPIDRWLREDMHDYALEVLTSQAARQRGLFKPDYAPRIIAEHRAGRRQNHLRIYTMLMLELWYAAWIDDASKLEQSAA